MKPAAARQKWGQLTEDARKAVEAAKETALASNADDQKRLAKLSAEISTMDATLDPHNLEAIQLLAAKRDQYSRLEKKFAADAVARLKNAGRGVEFPPGNFIEAVNGELGDITAVVQQFCADEKSARRVACETDSGRVLARFLELERSFGGPSAADYDRALRCFALGKQFWDW